MSRQFRTVFALLFGLAAAPLLIPTVAASAPANPAPTAAGSPTCTQSADPDEPPCNPWLAQSTSSGTHKDGYRQSSYPGATSRTGKMAAKNLSLQGVVPIWVIPSAPYPDGSRVVWMNLAGTDRIVKADEKTFTIIAQTPAAMIHEGIGVAYYELNRNNQVIRLNQNMIEAFGDAVPGDPKSKIVKIASYSIPDSVKCRTEGLVGIAHTYDGHIIVGTELGSFVVLPADPTQWNAVGAVSGWSMNGDRCTDSSIESEALESMTNNFAADETGGVFPVSSAAQYRLDWDGSSLRKTWRSTYELGTGGVLGNGSGATPTLMGTPGQRDQLVVITDAQPIMHFVAYWRGNVPTDWTPLPGRDPRVACEIPVNFGDPSRTTTRSDQSVTVAGYSAVVVDNTLRGGLDKVYSALPASQQPLPIGLAGGDPAQSPHGAARIDWDPATRTCRTVWNNPTVHFPNGIPMVSRGSGLLLGNSIDIRPSGQVVYGARALNMSDGSPRWFVAGERQACGTTAPMQSLLTPVLAAVGRLPVLAALTNACENALFAGLTMGPNGTLYTGTFQGASRFVPDPSDIG